LININKELCFCEEKKALPIFGAFRSFNNLEKSAFVEWGSIV
jgi:hypothetical protein